MYSEGFKQLNRETQKEQEAIIPQNTLMYLMAISDDFGYKVVIGNNGAKFLADVYTNPLGGYEQKEVGFVAFKKTGLILKIYENNDLVGNPMLPFFLEVVDDTELLSAICGLE